MWTMTRASRAAVLLFVTALVPCTVLAQRSQARAAITDEQIFDTLGLTEGSTLCEIGAGAGSASVAAARLVGSRGRVFTTELGDERVGRLQEAVRRSGLDNVTVVAGEADRTNLPEAACDAVLLRDVYHHLTEPAAMNASIFAAARPGARVAVVDFTPPREEAATPADRGKDGMHGVLPATVSRELAQAGFQIVSGDPAAERWFMVVARKPER
jgi:precorrin-6B methylase 2